MSLLIAAFSTGITIALSGLSLFGLFELKGLDLLFTLRGPLTAPKEIVIVAIDEPSLAEMGKQWPWPRGMHATLMRQLDKAGAKVVGFDILFSEPSDPAQDEEFAKTLTELGNGVLVSELAIVSDPLFRHTSRVDPIEPLRNAAPAGIPMMRLDADGTVRRAKLFAPDMPSFAYVLLKTYLGGDGDTSATPALQDIQMHESMRERLIDFLGPPRTVETVSYYQALDYERLLPPGIFKDKIVLIGRSAEATPEPFGMTGDTFRTPFSWVSETPTAGVEIQANILAGLLNGRFIGELEEPAKSLLIFFATLATCLILARLKPVHALAVTMLLSTIAMGIAWLVFVRVSLWIPLFSIVTGLLLTYGAHMLVRTLEAERERRAALELLNRSLELKVAERTRALARANDELREQHQQLETAYRELGLAQEHLIQSEKMASLGLLVAGVAHELNNPISFVHSNLEFIDEYSERLSQIIEAYGDDRPEEGRRRGDRERDEGNFLQTFGTLQTLIKSSKEGAERVKKIVLDLRTFSRTDDIGLIPFDLHEGIESTLNLLAKQYQDRVTIHRNYAHLPLIECYPGQLNQVFMNILQNAVQAIPERGDLWITTETEDDRARVSIRDTGVGIPEDQLARVFDPFFTTKPVGTGTGLGLSISYGIIKRHGGTLTVSSRVGEGTEFLIELPAHGPKNDQ